MLYLYEKNASIPNLHKWDFVDSPQFICSNHQKHNDRVYECLGHEDGDYFYPSFHGDPTRSNKLWIYPLYRDLVTSAWDFYKLPCSSCKMIRNHSDQGPVEF